MLADIEWIGDEGAGKIEENSKESYGSLEENDREKWH